MLLGLVGILGLPERGAGQEGSQRLLQLAGLLAEELGTSGMHTARALSAAAVEAALEPGELLGRWNAHALRPIAGTMDFTRQSA